MFVVKMPSTREYNAYRYLYSNADGDNAFASAETVLRFWQRNKQTLYKMLGEEHILTKKVTFERPRSELYADLEEMKREHRGFIYQYNEKVDALYPYQGYLWDLYDDDGNEILNEQKLLIQKKRDALMNMLSANAMIDNITSYAFDVEINKKKIVIPKGMKMMKALGKICEAMGLTEDFEAYRIAHSQVLNQKFLTGELCLSIHPMDYATASDNNQGWSSCMSWKESGCYRMGTVEMMNSPYVLCAYLKSEKNEMTFQDCVPGSETKGEMLKWNSKKWRAWIVVDEDIILCNRQYPYDNDAIATMAVEWARELAISNLGWDSYSIVDEHDIEAAGFEFWTNYMYNDIGCDHISCFNPDIEYGQKSINFSGEAVCQWCGEEIGYDDNYRDDNANAVVCDTCRQVYRCDECGRDITGCEEEYVDPDTGERLCADCYYERFVYCEVCQEYHRRDDSYNVTIPMNTVLHGTLLWDIAKRQDVRDYIGYPWSYHEGRDFSQLLRALRDSYEINICWDCLKEMGIDPDEDFISGNMRKYMYWCSSTENTFYHDVLDASKLSYEQFCKLVEWQTNPKYLRFPEQEEIQRKLFENYKTRVADLRLRYEVNNGSTYGMDGEEFKTMAGEYTAKAYALMA